MLGSAEHGGPGRGGGGEGNHPDLQRGGRDRGQQRQIPQGTKMSFFLSGRKFWDMMDPVRLLW